MKEQCEHCKKPFFSKKYVYSYCYHGYVCLDCYHKQFPALPYYPTPIQITGYNQGVKQLSSS